MGASVAAQSATLGNVALNTASVVLFAARSACRQRIIVNDSDQALHVALAATASLTSYTYKIAAGGTLELPQPSYAGVVSGIWAAAGTGAARTTWY